MPDLIQASLPFTLDNILNMSSAHTWLLTTDLWHVWIELDGSVYGLHGVHLRRAQPSSGRSLWREPETKGWFKIGLWACTWIWYIVGCIYCRVSAALHCHGYARKKKKKRFLKYIMHLWYFALRILLESPRCNFSPTLSLHFCTCTAPCRSKPDVSVR